MSEGSIKNKRKTNSFFDVSAFSIESQCEDVMDDEEWEDDMDDIPEEEFAQHRIEVEKRYAKRQAILNQTQYWIQPPNILDTLQQKGNNQTFIMDEQSSVEAIVPTNNPEMVVWYFIRNEYEEKYKQIHCPVPLKYLILAYSKQIIGSRILTYKQDYEFMQKLSSKLSSINRFNLLYRASENEFSAKAFHKLCDNHGPTICLIKSNFGNIFGGYTHVPWSSSYNGSHQDKDAFLFLIHSNDVSVQPKCPLVFECISPGSAVYHDVSSGPTFGFHRALRIWDKCNRSITSSSPKNMLLHNYTLQSNDFNYDGLKETTLCGGNEQYKHMSAYLFQTLEYEVFEIE